MNKDGPLYRTAQSWKWSVARLLLGGTGTYGAQLAIPWGERTWEYPWILRQVPDSAVTVLDVGPGPDSPLPLWLHCQGLRVTTVDLRKPSVPMTGIDARVGDFATLPLPERSFDVVTCVSVFEHLSVPSYGRAADPARPVSLLKRMGDMLTPAGRILLTVPTGHSGESRIREDAYRVHAPSELRDLASAASLAIVREDYAQLGAGGSWQPATAAEVSVLDSTRRINALAGLVLSRKQ